MHKLCGPNAADTPNFSGEGVELRAVAAVVRRRRRARWVRVGEKGWVVWKSARPKGPSKVPCRNRASSSPAESKLRSLACPLRRPPAQFVQGGELASSRVVPAQFEQRCWRQARSSHTGERYHCPPHLTVRTLRRPSAHAPTYYLFTSVPSSYLVVPPLWPSASNVLNTQRSSPANRRNYRELPGASRREMLAAAFSMIFAHHWRRLSARACVLSASFLVILPASDLLSLTPAYTPNDFDGARHAMYHVLL